MASSVAMGYKTRCCKILDPRRFAMFPRAAFFLIFCLFAGLGAIPPAEADEGVIAVRGIDVDVTAGNAVDARTQAVLQGQRKGLSQALLMLAPGADVSRFQQLSDSQITDLVADYEVESEQTSTVRYIGKLAFRYRARSRSVPIRLRNRPPGR